jgi:hypothetical protein
MKLQNLLEENENPNRIRSLGSNDGYFPAVPIVLPSLRNNHAALAMAEI